MAGLQVLCAFLIRNSFVRVAIVAQFSCLIITPLAATLRILVLLLPIRSSLFLLALPVILVSFFRVRRILLPVPVIFCHTQNFK